VRGARVLPCLRALLRAPSIFVFPPRTCRSLFPRPARGTSFSRLFRFLFLALVPHLSGCESPLQDLLSSFFSCKSFHWSFPTDSFEAPAAYPPFSFVAGFSYVHCRCLGLRASWLTTFAGSLRTASHFGPSMLSSLDSICLPYDFTFS